MGKYLNLSGLEKLIERINDLINAKSKIQIEHLTERDNSITININKPYVILSFPNECSTEQTVNMIYGSSATETVIDITVGKQISSSAAKKININNNSVAIYDVYNDRTTTSNILLNANSVYRLIIRSGCNYAILYKLYGK